MATQQNLAAATPKQANPMSYPQQLKQMAQQASAPRSEMVHDSFYTHFLYEMLNSIILKHEKGRNAASDAEMNDGRGVANAAQTEADESVKQEVEQLGGELGKRASDQLAIGQNEQQIEQIDKTRFLCCQVWTYLFNHRVTTLKSNGQGAYQIIDDANEFLVRLSSDDPENPEYKRKISVFKAFVIGIIKGVLYNLGAEG